MNSKNSPLPTSKFDSNMNNILGSFISWTRHTNFLSYLLLSDFYFSRFFLPWFICLIKNAKNSFLCQFPHPTLRNLLHPETAAAAQSESAKQQGRTSFRQTIVALLNIFHFQALYLWLIKILWGKKEEDEEKLFIAPKVQKELKLKEKHLIILSQFSRNNFPLELNCSKKLDVVDFWCCIKNEFKRRQFLTLSLLLAFTSSPFYIKRKVCKSSSKNRCEFMSTFLATVESRMNARRTKKNILNKFSSSIKLNAGRDKNVYLFWKKFMTSLNLFRHLRRNGPQIRFLCKLWKG